MRHSLKTFLALVVLIVAAAAGYGAWYVSTRLDVAKLPVEVEIPRGAGFRAAVDQLEKAGIRVRPLEFELLARALGRERDIKAGSYEIAQPVTPTELLDKLTRGDVTQAEIRLIEGWTFAQLRGALDASPDLRHETTGLEDAQVLALLQASESHPEGLFFPDTYLFAKGSRDLRVLRRAYRAMQRHLKEEWEARSPNVPYRSPYEALIMASIVEKETGKASERDLIGGVLVNRLRIGMRLQADPTVIYGLGSAFDGNLKKIHLLEDGPYNTYTRAGLPPTPIAMPGFASLRSALRPGKTEALYYVSKGDGSSQFSRTLDEHNRAVSRFQRGGR
ncbi:MAG: aminodeoxychorismate lyase [Betaproteobacteria bacterium RIFCSPLOWO2_12_FULL_65_14]|nr:MAG: aminodeoxychorismate lyase [Betaproteobacteria bacterium RIFCSPLOWO2_12_FULL_65_14]